MRGLEHLGGLRQLESLSIYETRITDVGLVHLKKLSHLKNLELFDTLVTDQGVKELKRTLPDCKITRQSDQD